MWIQETWEFLQCNFTMATETGNRNGFGFVQGYEDTYPFSTEIMSR
jgi:hypothetical protein